MSDATANGLEEAYEPIASQQVESEGLPAATGILVGISAGVVCWGAIIAAFIF